MASIYDHVMRPIVRTATVLAVFCVCASSASAQVDCVAPRETMNSVMTAKFTPIRQVLLTIEDIINNNAAYKLSPEPVRMRTTISAGPSENGGSQTFVRAYPERQTTAGLRIWSNDKCDVIPQAERVAASIGQIYVFVNYNVQEQFLGGLEVPQYQGEFAGYPIYNNWIVITKDRRLPWIPQTLGDRLDREETKRQRAIEDWNGIKAGRKLLDETAQLKTYNMLKQTDPAGAEKFLAGVREVNEQLTKAKAEEPIMDAHLAGHLKAVRDYRASFTAAELAAPAMWVDASGDARKKLDARIAALQALTPEEEQLATTTGRRGDIRRAHLDKAIFPIQDATSEFDLVNLKPGPKEKALAFKPDPTFPDLKDAFRPQLITINFWSKSDPKDNSPRTLWLRKARETFDFAPLAALLR